jgi:hypothetical protein
VPLFDAMQPLLDSDALPMAIVGMILIEGGLLLAWHRRTQNGLRPALLFSFLGAGLALVSALYFHRRPDSGAAGFALSMLAALVFHLWHVALLARR